MEPGHEDREYIWRLLGNPPLYIASMEPGHEDREYRPRWTGPRRCHRASMEPGHEDREYPDARGELPEAARRPQWSPVMKTGNTPHSPGPDLRDRAASMEPGHEDREYHPGG